MVRPATDHLAPDQSEAVEALEHRVRRLEDAVAALQDTQLMEDRVVERVAQRVERAPLPLHEPAGLIVDAPRMLLPMAVEAVAGDGPAPAADDKATGAAAVRSTWLLLDAYREFRAVVRMLADYRYRMTWASRFVLAGAVGVAVLSWLLLSGSFWGVGTVIDRATLVVVVVVIYKVLTREVQRYQELLARIYRYR